MREPITGLGLPTVVLDQHRVQLEVQLAVGYTAGIGAKRECVTGLAHSRASSA